VDLVISRGARNCHSSIDLADIRGKKHFVDGYNE
jgi:hypothetical protein